MKKESVEWDVAVIGGGAAGMMAAGTAAARGARVILIEKNPTLGKKLLITGGGRCNVTNAESSTRAFLAKFNGRNRKDGQFLFSAFAQFSIDDTLKFFNSHGMETKVEALGRVFPVSDSAQSVWNVLVAYMKEGTVRVLAGHTVQECLKKDDSIMGIRLANEQLIRAKSYIFATGGKSRPETGSTGDGFNWLKKLGHTISETDAALVPITAQDAWPKECAGVTLDDVRLTVYQEGARQNRVRGRLLFTHVGVTGPTILNMSKDIGALLKYGPVTIAIDLLPDISLDALDARLRNIIHANSNKKIKNIMSELILSSLISPVLQNARAGGDTFAHSLTREERLSIVRSIKALPLQVKGLLGFEKAVVTSGGVALTEIDFKTMRSRIITNLYIVGDLLNLNRPSGGYSLQICWTTGAVAGMAAARDAGAP